MMNKIFDMTDLYEQQEEITCISLDDSPILALGGIMTLIAPVGVGLSSICEAFCANGVNPECDAFGFKISLRKDKAILLIDTERTKNDMHRGYRRIHNRAKADLKNFRFTSYRYMDTDEFIKELHYNIESGAFDLIIIDYISDIKILDKIKQLTFIYDIAIFCTLALDECDTEFGKKLIRMSETVMLCQKSKEKDHRVVTANFQYGKVRNGYDILETAFEWNDELKMHTRYDLNKKKMSTKKIKV